MEPIFWAVYFKIAPSPWPSVSPTIAPGPCGDSVAQSYFLSARESLLSVIAYLIEGEIVGPKKYK